MRETSTGRETPHGLHREWANEDVDEYVVRYYRTVPGCCGWTNSGVETYTCERQAQRASRRLSAERNVYGVEIWHLTNTKTKVELQDTPIKVT
jgi:hypothetical protein